MRGVVHVGDVFLQNDWFLFCPVVTHLGYPTAISTAASSVWASAGMCDSYSGKGWNEIGEKG